MTTVYYALLDEKPRVELPGEVLTLVSEDFFNDCHYKPLTRNKQLSRLGKLLLVAVFQKHNLDLSLLLQIRRTRFNRPFIPDSGIDFNISHSGDMAAVVISDKGRVGIDVEQINSVCLEDFSDIFSREEIDFVSCSVFRFYYLRTIKEAVVKADGRGLNIRMQDVRIDHSRQMAFLDNLEYHIRHCHVGLDYTMHVCLESDDEIELIKFSEDIT